MIYATQFKLAGTKSWRLSSSQLFETGGNCLTGDTEVLLASGQWARLDQCNPSVKALCWNIVTNELTFEQCSLIRSSTDVLYTADGWFHTLRYTPNHRIPYRSPGSTKWRTATADLLYNTTVQLPVSAVYKGTNAVLTPDQASVIVMLQADFSFDGYSWRGTFKKQHKKERFNVLAKTGYFTFSQQTSEGPEYVRYSVKPLFDVSRWLDPVTKTFNKDLLHTSIATRKQFLEELQYWDGSVKPQSTSWIYINTNSANIELCQLLAHTVNWRASISINVNNNRGYGQGNNKPLYKLNIKLANHVTIEAHKWSVRDTNESVYCLETPTGYFICRRNGVIHLTHNSQNIGKDSLTCFVSRPGYSFVQADQSGAEALIVAYLSKPGRYRELFINGIKPHTYIAMHLFHQQYNWGVTEDMLSMSISELAHLPNWKSIDSLIKKSGHPYDIGKRTAHARSYRMAWRTFLMSNLKQSKGTLVLSVKEAKAFLELFDKLFPEVINWQLEIEAIIKSTKTLHNLFGFPRTFYRKPTDSYVREAISWIPQSTVGCLTHKAYIETDDYITEHRRDWTLLNNKHDSYLMEVPDAEILEAGKFMQRCLKHTFTGRDGVQFTMNSEVQAGKDWAHMERIL